MRTSRISKEASRIASILSSTNRRQTRSTSATQNKRESDSVDSPALNILDDLGSDTDSSVLSSVHTTDIEDVLEESSSRKRKRASTTVTSLSSTNNASSTRTSRSSRSPRKVIVQGVEAREKSSSRRLPARKSRAADGSVVVEPPSNWEQMYSIVKEMRLRNPTAPVDTMGCAELYWRSSSPRDRRFHTLIALMLSSQTKDTVTAVAMQRLHTELGPEHDHNSGNNATRGTVKVEDGEVEKKTPIWDHTKQEGQSTLTLENILAVSPARLNELIGAVGFHNNKTKYIKAAAEILRDEYDSDIPSTPEGLMRLPGVGPKMAYLCMSAAWGRHEGIGVDVHVHRITNLWGWHKTKTPEETRKALESWLPKDKWHEINKLLVGLGQTVCLPVGRRCGECDLAGTGLCKAEIKGAGKAKGKEPTVKAQEESKVEIKIETEAE
ncbi:hypothetical protein VTO42DRAFT_7125 [Malbranchea cinnamomea]